MKKKFWIPTGIVGSILILLVFWYVLVEYSFIYSPNVSFSSLDSTIPNEDYTCKENSDCVSVQCGGCDGIGKVVSKTVQKKYYNTQECKELIKMSHLCVPGLPSYAYCVEGQCRGSFSPPLLFCLGELCVQKSNLTGWY